MVEGMIGRIRAELHEPARAVATGGLAEVLSADIPSIEAVDPVLTLKGLRIGRPAGRIDHTEPTDHTHTGHGEYHLTDQRQQGQDKPRPMPGPATGQHNNTQHHTGRTQQNRQSRPPTTQHRREQHEHERRTTQHRRNEPRLGITLSSQ